jgi:hypothetical protein
MEPHGDAAHRRACHTLPRLQRHIGRHRPRVDPGPGDGLPIVLLAEHQTTGGYPKIGAVISADLPALGRLGVGSRFAFERVSLEEAEAAGRAHLAFVERLPSRLSPLTAAWSPDLPARLSETNLVSGVIDACAWG